MLKQETKNLLSNIKLVKLLEWGKLVSITGSAQLLIQAFGLLSGILVIRLLPTKEYALYTLANTMLGTMIIFADGGISTGITAHGGKVWLDRQKLGAVLATGLDLRRKFSIISLSVSVPVLVYLLLHHDASWMTSIFIVSSLVLGFFAALSDSLLEIIPRLHQEIIPLQKNQLIVGIWRLVLSVLLVIVFPWAFIAILAAAVPRIYGNIQLRKIAMGFVDEAKPDTRIRGEILGIVKRTMPGLIYYCVSTQLTIWFLSIMGSTTSIAQIGALGRVVMLLNIFGVTFTTILIPRFARLSEESGQVAKRFILIVLLFVSVCIIFIGATYVFSNQILWVLGPAYKTMNYELLLYLFGSCVFLCTGFIYNLISSRGLVLNPLIYITFSLVAIVTGVLIFDISTLIGVLYFNLYVSLIQLLMYITYSYVKIIKTRKLT
ncbi:polysaccharide biosynthesis protein [Segetibacter sp. 3557_3]|nr:polysaccharide biosynthesis protein [Segetibacter sp. 3557_3]